jgi:hypothetical protein
MNLAGVLSPKWWITSFLLVSFFPFAVNAQNTQKADAAEQTSFSMEFPFERPVLLGEAAKKALATDRGIADVMKDEHLSIESIPKDWFTASEVHLGPKSETDLVVMGLGISLGPYNAGFWILRQTTDGCEIVLAVNTHDLALLDTSTNGLRDIETGLPTGGQRYSDIYRFDGHRYQIGPPIQESQSSKVPAGESQFTPEQLEQYYLVYKNSDVRYLRTLFDSYLNNSGVTEEERQQLQNWNKDYFRSRFIVMSRGNNTFGGTLITILFQGHPDKVFVAWVYPEGSKKQLTLKKFDVGSFSGEDIKRIRVRYKKLIEDKVHAM